jgi:hypothetical protein
VDFLLLHVRGHFSLDSHEQILCLQASAMLFFSITDDVQSSNVLLSSRKMELDARELARHAVHFVSYHLAILILI